MGTVVAKSNRTNGAIGIDEVCMYGVIFLCIVLEALNWLGYCIEESSVYELNVFIF